MNKLVRTLALVGVSGSLLVSQGAGAQEQPGGGQERGRQGGQEQGRQQQQQQGEAANRPMGQQIAEVVNVRGAVESVDQKNRKLVLKDPEGQRISVQVPAEVRGLERLKKGDEVDLGYYQSIAMSILPPGAGQPRAEERVVGTRRMSGGEVAREISAAMVVQSVDANKGTVTFKAPDGTARTVKVQDPEARQMLRDLKAGDVVQITFTEALATTIEPHAKTKAQ